MCYITQFLTHLTRFCDLTAAVTLFTVKEKDNQRAKSLVILTGNLRAKTQTRFLKFTFSGAVPG